MTTFNDQPQPFVSSKTARAMARLLADEYGFRVRKVDTIRLMEGRNGRRRVSLDVVVPDDTWLAYDRGLPRAKRLTMVPVARPHKSVMRDLDTHDASGTTLPVLTRQENTDIAASVVVYELLGRRGYDSASPELWQAITSIVGGDSQQSVQDAETLIETGCHAGRRVLDPPDLSELAVHLLRDLAECFLLIALVPQSSAGERVLVKYSFHWGAEDASAERRAVWWRTVRAALGWSDYPLRIGVGGAAEALSHHLEVHAPRGLATAGLEFPRSPLTSNSSDSAVSSVAHAVETYVPAVSEEDLEGEAVPAGPRIATLQLRVPRGGVRLVALISTLITALVFSLEQVLPGAHETLLERSDGAAALLLAAPAIVIALMIGTDENRLTGHLLRPLRFIIFLCSTSLAIGAASLVGQLHDPWITILWRGGAILHTILFLLVVSGYAAGTVRGRRNTHDTVARIEGAGS